MLVGYVGGVGRNTRWCVSPQRVLHCTGGGDEGGHVGGGVVVVMLGRRREKEKERGRRKCERK